MNTALFVITPEQRARAQAVAAAVADESRCYVLNRPAREASAPLREANAKIKKNLRDLTDPDKRDALRARIQPVPPLPYQVSPQARLLLHDEQRAKNALNKVGPIEWRRRIDALPWALRVTVASIIWWDYFGPRLSAEKWPELDDLIKHRAHDFPNDAISAALITCGYTPLMALERVRNKDANETTNQEAA